MMILGSKVAAEYRAIVETTFTRVMAGDKTLFKVIEANAASSAPINEACRNALEMDTDAGGVSDQTLEDMTLKRKRTEEVDEWEMSKRKMEMSERMARISKMKAETEQLMINNEKLRFSNAITFRDEFSVFCDDDRSKLMIKDYVMNVVLTANNRTNNKQITNGDDFEDNTPITVSVIAKDMGYGLLPSGELSQLGKVIKSLYMEKHNGKEPSKHPQLVNGASIPVCSYAVKDLDVVKQGIEQYMKTRGEQQKTTKKRACCK
jgi:hypothetical protein